jgi:hypothetical protein
MASLLSFLLFLSYLAKYITYYAEQPFWRLFWRGCLSFFALIIFSSSSGTFLVRLKTIINAKGGAREHNTPGFRCILSVLMDRRTPPSHWLVALQGEGMRQKARPQKACNFATDINVKACESAVVLHTVGEMQQS